MMDGIKLKACPKCGGATYRSSDRYGEFRSCFQCGHLMSEGSPPPEPPGHRAWHAKGKRSGRLEHDGV